MSRLPLFAWILILAIAVDSSPSLLRADKPAIAESRVPTQYDLPFTAADREAAEAWQMKSRERLLALVASQTPRHSTDEQPLDFKIESTEDRGDYSLHRASFRGNDGERRECLWTTPKGEGPFPAMLCLHGHGGSAADVFDSKGPYRGFAERFARGGYCVLAPSFPHRDYAASTLWDLIRCVDILSARSEVDRDRIGVMGLSMGGEWTMWAAACDLRLKVAVVSGWMCTTEGVFSVPNCKCWLLPGLANLMDVCEAHLSIAPRPVLFESAAGDPCFPIHYVREGFSRIRGGYRVFGAEDACIHDVFPGGHAVHGRIAYPFVDKVLGGHAGDDALPDDGKPKQPKIEINDREADGQLQVTIDGREAVVYRYGKDVDLPNFYPVRSPSGQLLTLPKAQDHPHHLSIWIADTVSLSPEKSANFYMGVYSKDAKNPEAGFRDRIRHLKFSKKEAADGQAIFEEQLVWETDFGKTPMLDEWRRCRVVPLENGEYLLDLKFRVTASYGNATFTSNRKEYAWPYVRLAPPYAMNRGAAMTGSEGVIAKNEIDAEWGIYAKRARWIDCSATPESCGVIEGLAIFAADRQSPRWLTRDYGVFGPRRSDDQSGVPFTLKKGDSLEQRVGILVHSGDAKGGQVERRYERFLEGKL